MTELNNTTILRIEAILFLCCLLAVYQYLGQNWMFFLYLFLLPDIALIGYLVSAKAGAMLYNSTHSYIGPLLLASVVIYEPTAIGFAVIWASHIAFDRALGYGLKELKGFHYTHLGLIGKALKKDSSNASSAD